MTELDVRAPVRLVAVDVARAVALIGMMATHVLPDDRSGVSGLAHGLAGGRASALFAVLAGVSLALGSGGDRPTPERLRFARWATVTRAVVIAVIGLTLGGLPTPAAIILCYYACLFLLAPLVLGWPARRLAVVAGAWAVLAPVASHVLRRAGDLGGPGPNLSWAGLSSPGVVLQHLLLTGYYPVLTWITYLLTGLAAGRLALGSPRVARNLAVAGAGLALLGRLVGEITVRLSDCAVPATGTRYGTGDTGSWWWLGADIAHTGEIGDLVHTTGTSLLVIGLALLVVTRVSPALIKPFAAAGAMTLTLYSAHVVALAVGKALEADLGLAWWVLIVHVLVALGFATFWGSPRRRGPLEELVATAIEVTVPRRTA
jgi:uncharacterized membrane protein